MHLERRPDHRRPLLYPDQAVVVGVYGGGVEAYAVVSNHQVNPVDAKDQAHGHLLGGAVTLRVGQGLIGGSLYGSPSFCYAPPCHEGAPSPRPVR